MSSRIIVLDDDESMRLLCLNALEFAGHRVSSTGHPIEALALLEATAGPSCVSRLVRPSFERKSLSGWRQLARRRPHRVRAEIPGIRDNAPLPIRETTRGAGSRRICRSTVVCYR